MLSSASGAAAPSSFFGGEAIDSRLMTFFNFSVAFGAPRSQTSSESMACSSGSTVFESLVSTSSSTVLFVWANRNSKIVDNLVQVQCGAKTL